MVAHKNKEINLEQYWKTEATIIWKVDEQNTKFQKLYINFDLRR